MKEIKDGNISLRFRPRCFTRLRQTGQVESRGSATSRQHCDLCRISPSVYWGVPPPCPIPLPRLLSLWPKSPTLWHFSEHEIFHLSIALLYVLCSTKNCSTKWRRTTRRRRKPWQRKTRWLPSSTNWIQLDKMQRRPIKRCCRTEDAQVNVLQTNFFHVYKRKF